MMKMKLTVIALMLALVGCGNQSNRNTPTSSIMPIFSSKVYSGV